MFKLIDKFLNQITMYRLVLYYLIVLLLFAFVFGFVGLIPFNPFTLLFSVILITVVCFLANYLLAKVFKVVTNVESSYITALILACLIAPPANFSDVDFYVLATGTSILAIASKYILAIKRKHIFNPAAIAVVIMAVAFGQYAAWWIGTPVMFIPVLFGGLLLVRKLIRFDLVLSFLFVAILINLINLTNINNLWSNIWQFIAYSPILFFAFVMLTEPQTTPPTRYLRIIYGVVVSLLFLPAVHIGGIYLTLEFALVLGNIFSYIVSPKQKLVLTLKKKIQSAKDIVDFIFIPDQKLKFIAGQYMEWTINPKEADSRGNRRYFTIASSPSEDVIAIGVRFNQPSSTFKKHLLEMKPGDTIVASQLAGDFTLPKYNSTGENLSAQAGKKLVLIAGGIGITPYYSMIRNTIDKNEKRDIVLLYSNKVASDAIYQFLWDEAKEKIGLKTIHAVTDQADSKYTGRITQELIKKEIPNFTDRYFYLSGPHNMVTAFEDTLKSLGIKHSHIKTDFFPGY